MRLLLSGILLLSLNACTSGYFGNTAGQSVKKYRTALQKFQETEDIYLNVLFNLERMPNEKFLINREDSLRTALDRQREELAILEAEKRDRLFGWQRSILLQQDEMKMIKQQEAESDSRLRKQRRKIKSQLNVME